MGVTQSSWDITPTSTRIDLIGIYNAGATGPQGQLPSNTPGININLNPFAGWVGDVQGWFSTAGQNILKAGEVVLGAVVLDAAERRAAIARDQTGRVEAGAAIHLLLHQQKTHDRLRSGHQRAFLAKMVFVHKRRFAKGDFVVRGARETVRHSRVLHSPHTLLAL